MELKHELALKLRNCKRLVIMGIGNTLRTDDAIGIIIVKDLRSKVQGNVKVIECEMVPENYFAEIKKYKPTHVLVIDAAHFEAEPGNAKIIPSDMISSTALSTHAMPLSLFMKLIIDDTKAQVILLGIQPDSTKFGEGLSPKLLKAAPEIANAVINSLGSMK